ncbi:hypothetical protein WN48_07967 [Eufriesea mexicana]|uniref:Uncharacterized protein n=1 Tax=Eufriesea mexicana TaxID=516756 RepID=A0A310STH4_9HYME|nr:hypothetical protein WN48_07967 [Eufriesea mexicana]
MEKRLTLTFEHSIPRSYKLPKNTWDTPSDERNESYPRFITHFQDFIDDFIKDFVDVQYER